MLNLKDLVLESLNSSTSDDAILYRMGQYRLNWFTKDRVDAIVKRFHINKSNPRAGIIRYMKHDTVPIMKDAEEVIHRKDWDLDSLVGETEGQLLHPDYYALNKHIIGSHKRKHDTLTIFQCSSKKPYSENNMLKHDYFSIYGEFTDFACISNPGIIPIEFSSYYPYRYDEWNVMAEEKVEELVDLTYKYRIVNMCRLIRYYKNMGYKDVIVIIGNPKKQWIFDTMVKKNIAGAKDWLHIITTDTFRNYLMNKPKYSGFSKSVGMFGTRLPGLPETRKSYERTLKKVLTGSDVGDLKDVIKDNDARLAKSRGSRGTNESLINEDYSIKSSLNYTDIINKFKDSIKDNMSNDKVDKGSNDLYYKSYYWTALDILLIGLDGDLVEDIDGVYWDLVKHLKTDSKFENFDKFLFAYKPLLKKDDVRLNVIQNEAKELKIVKTQDGFNFTALN